MTVRCCTTLYSRQSETWSETSEDSESVTSPVGRESSPGSWQEEEEEEEEEEEWCLM